MIIQCEVCGHDRETRRRNTKYCEFHRFMKDLMYVQGTKHLATGTCKWCGLRFRRQRSDQLMCSDCVDNVSQAVVDCAICHEQRRGPIKDVRLCNHCLEYSEDWDTIRRSIIGKDRRLKEPPAAL
jgi:hypothetical protein